MKNKNVPKIRFKGFVEEWKETTLNGIAHINPKAELPDTFEYVDLESVLGTEMIGHREETKETAPSRAQRLAFKGDVFYQTVRPYQKNNYLFDLDCTNYVFSTGYAQMRPLNNSYFLLSLLQTDEFVKSVLLRCTGTSYPAINSTDLAKLDIVYPKDDTEQTHIGNFFQNIDNLINRNQKKLEKLKNFKKASLEKMFPKKGATTPEIRFNGFSGEWEERRIDEIFKVTRGNVLATPKTKTTPQNEYIYPVYSSQTKDNGLMGYYYEFLFSNAITWTTDGANAGTVCFRNGDFYCTNVCGVLLSDEGFANYMVAEALNMIAWKFVSKVGNPKLMNNTMSEINIVLPLNIKEQHILSEFILNCNTLISKQQAQLAKLKNIKKACLNKMFVTKE